ncbi:hypothetical protein DFJ73DRAFT_788549 [Zopfochytrium polystomum]|nr:hypothetical protein DFJ73DRAFT_788549 [Zopfochytrium polystomum]
MNPDQLASMMLQLRSYYYATFDDIPTYYIRNQADGIYQAFLLAVATQEKIDGGLWELVKVVHSQIVDRCAISEEFDAKAGQLFSGAVLGAVPAPLDKGECVVLKKDGSFQVKEPRGIRWPLYRWLLENQENPYPTDVQKRELAELTGLSTAQVSQFFVNARRRSTAENPWIRATYEV